MSEELQLGVCPKCGGTLTESEKAYGCENWRDKDGGCKQTVWKTIAQRAITPDEAKVILEGGTTELLDGFVGKSGKPFKTKLRMKEGDEGGVEFIFEND